MSRVAGRPFAACLFMLAAVSAASAADYNGRVSSGALAERCLPPRIVAARFEEQVCTRGEGGYEHCRWVDRVHEVRVPESCDAVLTGGDTRPATRGAYPPYRRLAPRG